MIAKTEGFPDERRSDPRAAPPSEDPRVVQALEEYLGAIDAGKPLNRGEFLSRHPDVVRELEDALGGLDFIEQAGRKLQAAEGPAAPEEESLRAEPLGDFRIVREIARGGMGVVYEAEQMSLGRKVALKVLPLAATMDARQLQRFKNEAAAAAHLHHQHIVPVYAHGCERGVHYYAMQFIDGQTLAQVIADLKAQSAGAKSSRDGGSPDPDPLGDTQLAALSTEHSRKDPAFFRTAARLGMQAAEALEHAHQLGVVHRDIKPGNLLIDLRGNLWVTDFGLAHMQTSTQLTMTGDLIGTLRYMSPEQALANRVLVDHRTDLYSLGATLYELLTLQPAYAGNDRQELLRQIAFEEPRSPRRINKSIPADLETIVLKAMEKNPAERYATAQDLADDLERFLKDESIRARRPTVFQRVRKWARRHRSVVRTAALGAIAFVLLLGIGLGWIVRDRDARQVILAERIQLELGEAEKLADRALTLVDENPYQWEATLAAALSSAERAEALAEPEKGRLDGELVSRLAAVKTRLQADEKDRQFVTGIDEIRLEAAETDVEKNVFKLGEQRSQIRELFKSHGIEFPRTTAEQVVALIEQRPKPIQQHMLAALDIWSHWVPAEAAQERLWVAAVRDAADQDPWRRDVRRALAARDGKTLQDLVRRVQVDRYPPAFLIMLAAGLPRDPKLVLLQQVQRAHPGDFWANHDYGMALKRAEPPRWDEAVRYLQAALALRPRSPGVYVNLGNALADKGDLDGAIASHRLAISLNRNYAVARRNLARVLRDKGNVDEAIAEYRLAIGLDPNSALVHNNLGNALSQKGDLDGAIDEYSRAITLDPKHANAHYNLGNALRDKGDPDRAIAAYRQAITVDPKYARAHNSLGNVLADKGELDEAIAEYRRAITVDPKHARAHYNLGNALSKKGVLDEAIAEYRRAITLDPKHVPARCGLGIALRKKGDLDGAIDAYRQAITLDPKHVDAHNNLGAALEKKDDLEEAIAEFRLAIRFDPKCVTAHRNLGSAMYRKGDFPGAVAAYEKAALLDPKNAWSHGNLGHALRANKDLDGAITAFRKAIELSPKSAWTYNDLGDALRAKGDLKGAIAEYRRAIRFDPKSAPSHRNLGSAMYRTGDFPGAVAAYEKAALLDPKNALRHGNLGHALRANKDLDGAITAFRKAIELSPKSAWTYSDLGGALREKGHVDAAIGLYRRAIELDPKSAVAHAELGSALCGRGDFAAGAAALQKTTELIPNGAWHWYQLANAHLALGQRDAYRKVCADMMKQYEKNKPPYWPDRILYTCLSVPDALPDMSVLIPLAEIASNGKSDPRTLSAALYRIGKYREAIGRLRQGSQDRAWDNLFLAMAHHHLGNAEMARTHLKTAVERIEKSGYSWTERIESETLRREAEALINGTGKDSEPKGKK